MEKMTQIVIKKLYNFIENSINDYYSILIEKNKKFYKERLKLKLGCIYFS